MNLCQALSDLKTIGGIIDFISCILIQSVVPLLFSIAIVAFIWGIIQMYLDPNNEEQRKKGKQYMIWGLIALFVMISVWGLVNVLGNTFNIKIFIPQLSQ